MKKYSKSNNRTQRKKIKLSKSLENIFIGKLVDLFKNKLKGIDFDKNILDIVNQVKSFEFKKLNKLTKRFGHDILKRNRKGFENILSAIQYGQGSKSLEKKFSLAIPSLLKEKKIYDSYMQKFQENLGLINNIPSEVADKLKEAYEQGQGLRGTKIEEFLEQKLKRRARLIVRTESSKINAALTETRAKSMGLNAYIWSSSLDQRVRESHKLMNGVLIFWDDAVTLDGWKGHAGEFVNCRCVSLPVFELDDIQFPIRVAENLVVESKYIKGSKGKYETIIRFGSLKLYKKEEFINKFGNKFKEVA